MSTAMKLRLRSLESKQTLKLEIPTTCTLQQLKQSLSQAISSSPSSLHFSLNRRAELQASSPDEPLRSLGVTAGDLIFYSLNPAAFVSVQTNPTQESETLCVTQDFKSKNGVSDAEKEKDETLVQESTKVEESGVISQESISVDCDLPVGNQEFPVQESLYREEREERQETMDIDGESLDIPDKKMSEPYFLRRVLREELGNDSSAHKLVVIAVHAVLLESGFIGFDENSGMRVDRFQLPDGWPSTASTVSLWYTLPELLTSNVTEYVVLKFQNIGHFINVYGSLAKDALGLYKVSLNRNKFAPIIDCVWANHVENNKNDSKNSACPEDEVFEFWKMVKDGLALPLSIELCEKTGLSLPPCLTRLPTELKLKILESLRGVDIAKMASVCTEMRYLALNNDLWKQKFVEEFGGGGSADKGVNNWKVKFMLQWENNKKRERAITPWRPQVARPAFFPIRRDPDPLRPPMVIGGDYDRAPGFGFPSPFGSTRPFPGLPGRRNFSPNCRLGGGFSGFNV